MPTGRFTTPREVATIVALLASSRMANVTGANWVIDGGLVRGCSRRHRNQTCRMCRCDTRASPTIASVRMTSEQTAELDDFRARRPRIGTRPLAWGEAEWLASQHLRPGPRPRRASRSPRGDARSCGEAAVGYGLVPSHALGPLAPSRCARDGHTVCSGSCVGGSRVECENSGNSYSDRRGNVVPTLFENVLLRLEGESLEHLPLARAPHNRLWGLRIFNFLR
jgi:Enoyl-(Acyl carrier protein) reductase